MQSFRDLTGTAPQPMLLTCFIATSPSEECGRGYGDLGSPVWGVCGKRRVKLHVDGQGYEGYEWVGYLIADGSVGETGSCQANSIKIYLKKTL